VKISFRSHHDYRQKVFLLCVFSGAFQGVSASCTFCHTLGAGKRAHVLSGMAVRQVSSVKVPKQKEVCLCRLPHLELPRQAHARVMQMISAWTHVAQTPCRKQERGCSWGQFVHRVPASLETSVLVVTPGRAPYYFRYRLDMGYPSRYLGNHSGKTMYKKSN
jgi:hypothetical protein